jgi:hypothetical protein
MKHLFLGQRFNQLDDDAAVVSAFDLWERLRDRNAFLGCQETRVLGTAAGLVIYAGDALEKVVGRYVEQLAELSHARAADAIGPFFVFLHLPKRQFDRSGYLLLAQVLLKPKGTKIAANNLVHRLLVGSVHFGHAVAPPRLTLSKYEIKEKL